MSVESFEQHSWIDDLLKKPPQVTPEKYLEFSRMLVEQIEEDLRFACYYNTQETELYIVNRDLIDVDLTSRIRKLHRRALEDFSMTGPAFEEEYGEAQIYVVVHEDVVVLNFRDESGNEGVIATLEYPGGFLDFL